MTSTTYPRGAASWIVPGDTVDVFAHPRGMFGATPPGGGGYGADVVGTVDTITPISLPFTTLPGLLLVMDDGREFECAETAVARLRKRHTARPDDLPEPGDRCKDCGQDITWLGPSQYDWEHCNEWGTR